MKQRVKKYALVTAGVVAFVSVFNGCVSLLVKQLNQREANNEASSAPAEQPAHQAVA